MTSEEMIVKISVIVCLIALVRSQTVWIDVTTGQVVGVSKSQNQRGNNNNQGFQRNVPVYQPVNRPTAGNPMWNCRNSETGIITPISNEVMLNTFPEIIQNVNTLTHNYPRYPRRRHYQSNFGRRKRDTLHPEWICTNTKTGDMLIVASEVMSEKFPSINSNTNNPYPNNPWLNEKNTPIPQPVTNVPSNQPNWGGNVPNNQPNWGNNVPNNPPNRGENNPPNWGGIVPNNQPNRGENNPNNQPNWGNNVPNNPPNRGENNPPNWGGIVPNNQSNRGENNPNNQPNWGENNPNNPPNWGNNLNNNPVNRPNVNIPVTTQPTELPAIILTTKKPFPTLEPINWLDYIETTTTTTTTKRPSLTQAIDGTDIIEPRIKSEK